MVAQLPFGRVRDPASSSARATQSFLSTSEPEVTTFDNKMGLSAGPMYRHAAVVLGTLANLVRFPIAVWQCSADCTVTLHCPPPPKAPFRDRAEVLFWRVCFACVGGCWPRFCDPIHIHGSHGTVEEQNGTCSSTLSIC